MKRMLNTECDLSVHVFFISWHPLTTQQPVGNNPNECFFVFFSIYSGASIHPNQLCILHSHTYFSEIYKFPLFSFFFIFFDFDFDHDAFTHHASQRVSIERVTSRKSDKSKSVSKERQEYGRFELKIVFVMTKLTLILTQNDPYDG